MAFDQTTRNRLQNFVSHSRALLTEEFTRQLQNDFGMDPDTGEVSHIDKLTHLNDTQIQNARLLRDTLKHYQKASPSGNAKEILGRIVREQAFTVLNRLCALRMAESRGILIESIGKAYNSKGFQLYARVAGTSLGETGDTYRNYLFSVFDEFITDIFLRYWWEIPLEIAFENTSKWQRLYNGGEYSRYVSHLSEAVVYGKNGESIENHKSTILRNRNFHKKALLGYGKRGEFVDAHILHPGFVSTVEGKAVIINDNISPFTVLALLNSKFFQSVINLYCGQHKHPGYVNIFPTVNLSCKKMIEAGDICERIVELKTIIYSGDETRPTFLSSNSICSFDDNYLHNYNEIIDKILIKEKKINELIYEAYDLTLDEISTIEKRCSTIQDSGFWFECLDENLKITSIISHILGIIFGRWDIRYIIDINEPPNAPESFASLPTCPPGMLQNKSSLPAEPKDVPDDYPIRITWSGIIVDDEGHPEDIVTRIREAIEVIWKDKAADIEQEACEILKIHSLREYFTKPAKFFTDHLKRYSKSRRQAPIYWPLSTPSGSYTLWLYYHRLNDQILYTCVNDFVELKLKQVSETAENLRKNTDRTQKQEKELEKYSDLEMEIKDFRDELLRIARFWKPNLNDGVQITAAPLWKLFQHKPWQKKLKQTWKELEKGQYDWAHLAYSIWPERVIKASHKDRSYAIAHDLEQDLWEEIETGKKDRQGNLKLKWVPKKLSQKEFEKITAEKKQAIKD